MSGNEVLEYKSAFESQGFEIVPDERGECDKLYLERNGQLVILGNDSGSYVSAEPLDQPAISLESLDDFSVTEELRDSTLITGDYHPDHFQLDFEYGEEAEEHVENMVDLMEEFDSLFE